jgi:hypothetical protein
MQIVVVVGDVIGQRRHLRLRARVGVQFQVMRVAIGRQRPGDRLGHRPVVLGDPFQRLPRQVQPVELRVVPFQMRHDADRLRVVVEPAIGRHRRRQRILAGVPERRMPEIMRQRHRLRQVLVQSQRAGHRARHLRHLQRVGQPRAEVVALMLHEDLGLVLQPPERRGMDDPVPVALERRAEQAFLLRHAAAAALRGIGRVGRAHGTASGCLPHLYRRRPAKTDRSGLYTDLLRTLASAQSGGRVLNILSILCVLFATVLTTGAAFSAEITRVGPIQTDPGLGCSYRMSGQILPGDADRLATTLRAEIAQIFNYPDFRTELQIVLCLEGPYSGLRMVHDGKRSFQHRLPPMGPLPRPAPPLARLSRRLSRLLNPTRRLRSPLRIPILNPPTCERPEPWNSPSPQR